LRIEHTPRKLGLGRMLPSTKVTNQTIDRRSGWV
jgi:hypothetical protein